MSATHNKATYTKAGNQVAHDVDFRNMRDIQEVRIHPSGRLVGPLDKSGMLRYAKLEPASANKIVMTHIDKLIGKHGIDSPEMKKFIAGLSTKNQASIAKFHGTFTTNMNAALDNKYMILRTYNINNYQELRGIQHYIDLVIPYVNNELGGIIGDAVKENFFTTGMSGGKKWPEHKQSTKEGRRYKRGEKQGQLKPKYKRYPYPDRPLHTTSYLGLPDNWMTFTYRWGGYGRYGELSETKQVVSQVSGKSYRVAKGASYAGRDIVQTGEKFKGVTKTGQRVRSGFTGYPQTRAGPESKDVGFYPGNFGGQSYSLAGVKGFIKGAKKFEGTPYGIIGGRSLMDTTALLLPMAHLTGTKEDGLAAQNYWRAQKKVMSNPGNAKTGWRNAKISVKQIVEPYLLRHPEAILAEVGTSTQEPRPWMAPGLSQGINRGHMLFEIYFDKTHAPKYEPMMREHALNMFAEMGKDINQFALIPPKARLAKELHDYIGPAGLKKMQSLGFVKNSMDEDIIPVKDKQARSLLDKLFASRNIWWFMPPTKYWHYIGMGSDILGLVRGHFFSTAVVSAYIAKLARGIAVARAAPGSPIKGTPPGMGPSWAQGGKAQRREFRKQMYTRLGYHRKDR